MSEASARLAGDNKYWQRVYAASSVGESRDLYDEWASKYDDDVSAADYATPELAAQAVTKLLRSLDRKDITILDAGCGTGLVGLRLKDLLDDVRFSITGLDLSEKMLAMAEVKKVYDNLQQADLSQPLALESNRFDVVVCVGTLTRGHVGPSVLGEFVRVAMPGGFVVATVLDEIWESAGFKKEVDRLSHTGQVEVLGLDTIGLTRGTTAGGRMVALKKL